MSMKSLKKFRECPIQVHQARNYHLSSLEVQVKHSSNVQKREILLIIVMNMILHKIL